MGRPHVHVATRRIVMSEVDVAQIHFTALYAWMDRAMCDFLWEIGHPFTRLLEEGPGVPIVESRCRYLQRIHLDDELTIRTTVCGIGTTSFRSRHRFTRAGELVADGELVHVCVDRRTRETVPVPDWLRAVASDEEPFEPRA